MVKDKEVEKVIVPVKYYDQNYELKTQKAKGLFYLTKDSIDYSYTSEYKKIGMFIPPTFIDSNYSLSPLKSQELEVYETPEFQRVLGLFARPCPIKPRHGFIDSRIVKTTKDLKEIIDETLAEDPEGEIVFMPYYNAPYSAVLSGTSITIGYGTDGVTSGKGKTITTSWNESILSLNNYTLRALINNREQYGVDYDQTVAIELLWDKGLCAWQIVQLRGITAQVGQVQSSYIPKKFIVENVNSNIAEYPQRLSKHIESLERDKPQSTLYKVNTMRSHGATQLVEAGLPVTENGEDCVIGKTLEATTELSVAPTLKDLRCLAGVLRWMFSKSMKDFTKAAGTLANVACASVMAKRTLFVDLKKEGDINLLAFGIFNMLWLSTAACIGEARHQFIRAKAGMSYHGLVHRIFKDLDKGIFMSRDKVYDEVLEKAKLPRILTLLSAAYNAHININWRSGYGGKAWGDIVISNMKLYESVRTFIDKPIEKTYREMLSCYNIASYTTHNGGRGALSKFPGQNLSYLAVLSNLGIYFLNNPPEKKYGALPKLRKLPTPKKASRFRRFPINKPGVYADADIIVRMMKLFNGRLNIEYMILISSVKWTEQNIPEGLVIRGEIDTESILDKVGIKASTIHAGSSSVMYFTGVKLTKKSIRFLTGTKFNNKSLLNKSLSNLLISTPMQIVRSSTLKKAKELGQIVEENINATYKYFVSQGVPSRTLNILIDHKNKEVL